MLTLSQATNLIDYLAAVFPHGKITDKTIPAYADALSDLDGDEVMAAARAYAKRGTFFPSPGALRELVEASQEPAYAPWDEVWAMAREKVSPRGYGRTYDFSDLALVAIKAIGGFDAIGQCDDKNRPFLANRFRDAYESRGELAKKHADHMIAKGEEPVLPESITRMLGDGLTRIGGKS